MLNNCFIQNQIDFNLIQNDILKSISKRFIKKKNVFFIYDSLAVKNTSNYEERIISDAITLTCNKCLNNFKGAGKNDKK